MPSSAYGRDMAFFSCPQAPSISEPRESRKVASTPSFSSSEIHLSTVAFDAGLKGDPSMSLTGRMFTWQSMP